MRASLIAASLATSAVIAAATVPVTAHAQSAGVATAAGNGTASVAVGSAPVGRTVIVNGKPCRVVARDGGDGGLSGTATAGPNGTSVSIAPGGAGGSVAVGSSSGANATAGCVVVKPSSGSH